MSTTDHLPQPPSPISLPATPPHPGVVESWDPNAHSAYYIEEIITWIKILLTIAGVILLGCAMYWALTTNVPYVGKLTLAGMVFSQISKCKKYVRRMRNLERWRERDLEVGDGEERGMEAEEFGEDEKRRGLEDRDGGGEKANIVLVDEKEIEVEDRGRGLSRVDWAEKGGL